MRTILKVLVGSQAHGLANPDSDYDFRGVFIVPTSEFFKIGAKKIDNTSWIEGKDDDTSWEIGHFLNLAVHCNPTILETFLAPKVVSFGPKGCYFGTPEEDRNIMINGWGDEIRDLFPYVWNSKGVYEAFLGYGINQRKKFFDNKDNRASKYAIAYLRTLCQGWELLSTGTFTVKAAESPVGEILKKWKAMNSLRIHSVAGEVLEECLRWEKHLEKAYKHNPNKQTGLDKVNEFLLKVRKEYWNE